MVEKFLADLFRVRRKQKIAILLDGEIVSNKLLKSLSTLVERLREIGEIKIAEVISEVKLSEEDYKYLRQAGFSDKIVPGNLELNYLLETYDMVLTDNSIDIVVLGTHRSSLIPLFTELRKQVTIFAYVIDNKMPKEFEECFDGVIGMDKLDEFNFNSADFSEFEPIVGIQNGSLVDFTAEYKEIVDDANIGITSEDMMEHKTIEKDSIETVSMTVKKQKGEKILNNEKDIGKIKETINVDKGNSHANVKINMQKTVTKIEEKNHKTGNNLKTKTVTKTKIDVNEHEEKKETKKKPMKKTVKKVIKSKNHDTNYKIGKNKAKPSNKKKKKLSKKKNTK